MTTITPHGYELSGLPSYGIGPHGICTQSYMLYAGTRPRAVRSDWRLVWRLTPAEVAHLTAEIETLPAERRGRVLEAVARGESLSEWMTAMRAGMAEQSRRRAEINAQAAREERAKYGPRVTV